MSLDYQVRKKPTKTDLKEAEAAGYIIVVNVNSTRRRKHVGRLRPHKVLVTYDTNLSDEAFKAWLPSAMTRRLRTRRDEDLGAAQALEQYPTECKVIAMYAYGKKKCPATLGVDRKTLMTWALEFLCYEANTCTLSITGMPALNMLLSAVKDEFRDNRKLREKYGI